LPPLPRRQRPFPDELTEYIFFYGEGALEIMQTANGRLSFSINSLGRSSLARLVCFFRNVKCVSLCIDSDENLSFLLALDLL
jgi:hypothetical protein